MKIKCLKSDLLNGINIVSKAIPNKTTMAILENILLTASDGEIKMLANDMELGIETLIPGEIYEKGIVAIDEKMFSDIIRKFPENDVFIETDDNLLTTLTCENTDMQIMGKDGDEFPELPKYEKENPLLISQFTLREIIKQTIFSIADNNSNKIMSGELFEIKDNKLKAVTLDGHRLSVRNIELKDSYDDKKVIIPGNTLNKISNIITGDINKDVNIYFNKNNIIFEFDNTVVVSRLIEGEYFKVDQMILNDSDIKVTVNRKQLVDCIDRATLFFKEGDKNPVRFNFVDNKLEISIKSQQGSMNSDFNIEKEGKDILIGFNPKLMLDALRVIEDENINIYMTAFNAPCIIKDDNGSYIYLILPVKVNS